MFAAQRDRGPGRRSRERFVLLPWENCYFEVAELPEGRAACRLGKREGQAWMSAATGGNQLLRGPVGGRPYGERRVLEAAEWKQEELGKLEREATWRAWNLVSLELKFGT